MTSKFAFLGKVAFGAVAAATLLASSASAATSTWKNGTTPAARIWGTATNWTPTGTPANGDTALFTGGAATTYGVTVSATTNELNLLSFTAGSGSYAFSGAGDVVVNGSIINNLTRVLPASGLGSGTSGIGSVSLNNVFLNGPTSLSGSGAGTEIRGNLGGSALSVTNTKLILNNVNATADISVSAGGTAVLNGAPTYTNLDIGAGGNVTGNGLDGDTNTFLATGSSLTLNGASTTGVRVGYVDPSTGFHDQFSTDSATLGGTLNIDWAQVGSSLFNDWTVAAEFFAGGALSGNFSTVNLVGGVAPYAGLTFTNTGNTWETGTFAGPSGPQWLVFQADTGNLVVVPEPSTMVFAGVGVAMAGWSVWKKRRLAMLAKKA